MQRPYFKTDNESVESDILILENKTSDLFPDRLFFNRHKLIYYS